MFLVRGSVNKRPWCDSKGVGNVLFVPFPYANGDENAPVVC
jgi:hypothetical protein